MEKLIININRKALVKLTETGAKILNEHNKKLEALTNYSTSFKTDYKENDDFISELWNIMHIFGEKITLGCQIPFYNNNITLIDDIIL